MSTTKALLKVAADADASAAAGWKLNWHRSKNDVFWGLQVRRSEPLEDFFASFRGRRCGEVDWTVILFFRFVVIVRLVVDEKGKIQKPQVETSTNSALNQAVLDGILSMRFEPATRGGKKVSCKVRLPIVIGAA